MIAQDVSPGARFNAYGNDLGVHGESVNEIVATQNSLASDQRTSWIAVS